MKETFFLSKRSSISMSPCPHALPGGENGYNVNGTTAAHEVAQPWVEVYHPDVNAWVVKAAMSEPRFR